jgi:hypothetical protein
MSIGELAVRHGALRAAHRAGATNSAICREHGEKTKGGFFARRFTPLHQNLSLRILWRWQPRYGRADVPAAARAPIERRTDNRYNWRDVNPRQSTVSVAWGRARSIFTALAYRRRWRTWV